MFNSLILLLGSGTLPCFVLFSRCFPVFSCWLQEHIMKLGKAIIFSTKYETCYYHKPYLIRFSKKMWSIYLQYVQLDLIEEANTTKILQSFIFSAYLITSYHNQQGLLDDVVDSNIWIIRFSFLFSVLDDSFDQKRMLAQMYVHALKLVSHSQLVPLCHIMLEFISSLNHFTACDTIINLNSI